MNFAERAGIAAPPFHVRSWKWLRLGMLIAVDLVILVGAYYLAFVLRLDDFSIAEYRSVFFYTWPWVVGLHILAFLFCGMYKQVWRYANYNSAVLIVKCMLLGMLVSVSGNFLFAREMMPPRSVPAIFFLLASLFVALVKFSWRAWSSLRLSLFADPQERCLIYGAGSAGDLLARHIVADPRFPYQAVGFVDDDRNKKGRLIHGLRIYGTGADLVRLAGELNVQTVILAMHTPSGKAIREIVKRCHEAKLKPLIMPDIAKSLDGDVFKPRAIDIRDLLRRSPKSIDQERVSHLIKDQTVLVTGAGGTIGSEICRQVIASKPKCLVLLDAAEFNLYSIEMELRDLGITGVEIHPVLGSVTDPRFLKRVFRDFRPNVVMHAAAYKHVPMVECNPMEGVINNLLGTRNVVEAAVANDVDRFLLISTDKAVRPTNVMGATKRACEMLVQAYSERRASKTVFCAVRFGNVLGSSGSVVPRFMQQIQSGGPITVTHPEVTRYFMLTSEAVGLVLQSLTMATRGEIFVLNMGEPVRIYDMATELVRLVGKEPGKDIEIIVTGLRPGEKLFEELILEGAEQHTLHDDVFIATPQVPDVDDTLETIAKIISLAQSSDDEGCLRLLRTLSGCIPMRTEPVEDVELSASTIH